MSQGRLTEAQSQWTPLRVNAASASEALALQWETSELERQLAHLKEKKLRPKEGRVRAKEFGNGHCGDQKGGSSEGRQGDCAPDPRWRCSGRSRRSG